MNYLQLVQELVYELGLSGSPTLTNVTGNAIREINNACRWIRDATLSIDNMWLDWRYHWNQFSSLTATPSGVPAGTQILPPPATPSVRQWDRKKFRWRPNGSGSQWQSVKYASRERMLIEYDPDNAVPGPPVAFTINPNNSVFFSSPFDVNYDFLGEFWQRPVALAASADTPLMPADFHRSIVCRAAVMYGNREDAPEIISGLEAEFIDIYDKLMSDQLESYSIRRNSTDRDTPAPHEQLDRFLL